MSRVSVVNVEERGPESQRSRGLRARILEVACEMFAERGYGATHMREVAKMAECTKPALYYHFDSKSALFLEALTSQTEDIGRLLEKQMTGPGSVRDRMERAMAAYFSHVRHNPRGLRLLLRAELQPEGDQPEFDFRSVRQSYLEMTTQLIASGVESGELRADINPLDAMHAVAGLADLRCMMCVLEGEEIPEDYAARVMDLIFRGIGA